MHNRLHSYAYYDPTGIDLRETSPIPVEVDAFIDS